MRTHVAIIVVAAVLGTAVMVALWGCGTTPFEQSFAVQARNPAVQDAGYSVGQKTDISEIMKQMRTAHLNLADSLLYGSPQAIISAAVQINIYGDELTRLQPAIALEGMDDAALWKRQAYEVKDMAVEVAKGIDSGKPDAADYYYTRMFQACNRCHRMFRKVGPPSEPAQIPEIETPKPVPTPEDTTPVPIPEPEPGPVE